MTSSPENQFTSRALDHLMAVDQMAAHLQDIHNDSSLGTTERRVQLAIAHDSIRRGQAAAKAWSQLAIAQEIRLLRESVATPARPVSILEGI